MSDMRKELETWHLYITKLNVPKRAKTAESVPKLGNAPKLLGTCQNMPTCQNYWERTKTCQRDKTIGNVQKKNANVPKLSAKTAQGAPRLANRIASLGRAY